MEFKAAYRYIKVPGRWFGNKSTKARIYAYYIYEADGNIRLIGSKFSRSLDIDFIDNNSECIMLYKGGKEIVVRNRKGLAARIMNDGQTKSERFRDEELDKTFEEVKSIIKNAIKKGWKKC